MRLRATDRRGSAAATLLVALGLAGAARAEPAAEPTLEPLFPKAALHGVHGLVFDESGRLYAAETWGMAIHQVDVETGAIRQVIPTPRGASDDVGVIGSGRPFAGTLVWSANFEGRVMARDPDGRIRELARDLPNINTIVISREGRVFATQVGAVNRLLEIDPAGVAAPRVILGDSGGLNGFAIAEDGTIYGPQQDVALSRVVHIDPMTGRIDVVSTGLAWPTGVKRAPDGTLYGVDLGSGAVYRLDPATGVRTGIAQFDPGLDNLAIGPDGHVYVSHIPTSSIFDIDPKTSRVRGVVRGRFGAPSGIACERGDSGDVVYVADLFTVKRIDVASRTVSTLVPLDRRSPFPTNVTVHGTHIVASSLFGGVVAVYDRQTGALLRRLDGFKSPHDAVELDDGRLVVAESGTKSLVVVDAQGGRATIAGVTDDFRGLAVERRDGAESASAASRVYAAGGTSGTLHRIDLATGRSEIVARGLGIAEGLALDRHGRALVVDRSVDALRSVDLATGRVRNVRRDLPLGLGAPDSLPPAHLHHGVAAADCSTVYVTSDRDGTVYALKAKRNR